MPKWIHALILADTYEGSSCLGTQHEIVVPTKKIKRKNKVREIRFYAFSYLLFFIYKKNTSGYAASESHGCNKEEV